MEYHDILALELEYEDYIAGMMESQRQENIKALMLFVCPDMAEIFSKILVFAYEDGCPEAEEIAERLEFSKFDFLAMDENFEGYKKEYERNQQWREYE